MLRRLACLSVGVLTSCAGVGGDVVTAIGWEIAHLTDADTGPHPVGDPAALTPADYGKPRECTPQKGWSEETVRRWCGRPHHIRGDCLIYDTETMTGGGVTVPRFSTLCFASGPTPRSRFVEVL
jgi:hypothetical protein